MNIIYKDIKYYGDFLNDNLTYRLSISCLDNNIIIKREYFIDDYSNDILDKFTNDYLNISIITRNFNKEYLIDLEKKLFDKYIKILNHYKIFYIKKNENIKNYTDEYFIEQRELTNIKINKINEILNFITSKIRIEKITKIFNNK